MIGDSGITIDRVFPWGRSFDEYRAMFALRNGDLNLRIVSCADGPAAFNAEMHRRGKRVVSCDPLYAFSTEQIGERVRATHDVMVEKASRLAHRFVWKNITSPQEMGQLRLRAM